MYVSTQTFLAMWEREEIYSYPRFKKITQFLIRNIYIKRSGKDINPRKDLHRLTTHSTRWYKSEQPSLFHNSTGNIRIIMKKAFATEAQIHVPPLRIKGSLRPTALHKACKHNIPRHIHIRELMLYTFTQPTAYLCTSTVLL
jgi:hypothetical protein